MIPKVVIIGGGFGGLHAAKALGRTPVHITLIDRRNYHLFQPLLYQVATAGLSPADIAYPIRSVLRKQEHVTVIMGEVTGIDPKKRLVFLEDRLTEYDYLVIATGSSHGYLGNDQWAKFAPGLKSIPDATAIRRKILTAFEAAEIESDPEKRKALLTFVLVGGGPTGVEMAGSIAELAHLALKSDFRSIDPQMTRILLIEAGPRILAGFPEKLAQRAMKKLEQFRVEIIPNTRVEDINESGVSYRGQQVLSKNIIWAAGVVASPAGKWLNAKTDRVGRVLVQEDLSVPGHPNIFVIGDTASFTQNGKTLPGVAPVAMQQGRYVGRVIRARVKGKANPPPFRYMNKGNLATVGRSFAIAEFGNFRTAGFFAWILWLIVHIYYLIGFRNRLLVLIQWAWAYFTFQRGARLITQENGTESH